MVGTTIWYPGQLEKELKEGYWVAAECLDRTTAQAIFFTDPSDALWGDMLAHLGGEFAALAQLPVDAVRSTLEHGFFEYGEQDDDLLDYDIIEYDGDM